MIFLAVIFSLVIGISLGLLGGGGSILTVPMLVYVLGLEPKSAIATSLLVVGITSAVGAAMHARAGRVRLRTGFVFGLAGMAGAYLGGSIAGYIPARALLLAFAAMMLITGAAMLRSKKEGARDEEQRERDAKEMPFFKMLLAGAGVGAVTGLVGAGGGFVVVPALVLLGGLPMRVAVGTGLLVIAMNSFAGFVGQVGHAQIDWRLAAIVTAAAVAGTFAGERLAPRISQARLRRIFAWLVIGMAMFLVMKELP
jgi:uncharacterized protein